MLNKVILIGRLGRDVEFRQAPSGTSIAVFSVATDEIIKRNGQKEVHTEWHRVIAFGKLADRCSEHLKKGRLVYIEGKIRTMKYEDREGNIRYLTEIHADRIRFLDNKRPDAIPEVQEEEEEIPF